MIFFRRVAAVRQRAAQSELFAAFETRAAARIVLVRLDVGVQAHLTVLIRRWGRVLRTERIVDDLISGEQGIVLALGPNAASIPTDVVGLLHRREQLQRALRREVSADGPNHCANLIYEFCDLRLTARRIGALLTRRDRGEPRLNALQVRQDAAVDAVGAAVLRLEGADALVALRARFMIQV